MVKLNLQFTGIVTLPEALTEELQLYITKKMSSLVADRVISNFFHQLRLHSRTNIELFSLKPNQAQLSWDDKILSLLEKYWQYKKIAAIGF